MELVNRFLPRTEFTSYDDFIKNYKVNIPEKFNFAHDIVDEWAKYDKTKKALIWCDDHDGYAEYTFEDMRVLSNQTANMLEAKGIQKGDIVMTMLKQRPEVWVTILALCKLGAVCIPASYQLTAKDIVYRANAADVKMIVAVDEADIIGQIKGAIADCPTVKSIGIVGDSIPDGDLYYDFRKTYIKYSSDFERRDIKNSDLMLMYFSSGTTGMPKMVMHDFEFPLGHIVTAKYWQKVQNGKAHLTATDSGWAKFAWGKIYGQWICGAIIAAYDSEGKFNASQFLSMVAKLKLTTFCAPPTVYRFLIKEDLSGADFSTIEHCSIAGEPLNPEVYNKFKELTGHALTEGFGQSESSVMLANFEWYDVKPGSMGKPSPLYNIDLIDEDGNSCEDGIVGAIVVRDFDKAHPVGLFRGYYRDDAANAKAIQNDMYFTGDTAWRDSDGYYWFEGRNDDVIKCSGYRIGPFEVENALFTHPCVLECAVTAAPDPVRGQVVKATIVLAKGFSASDELKKELQNHVKKVTAPYKYPRIIDFVTELPKTVSGKIRRVEIRQQDNK